MHKVFDSPLDVVYLGVMLLGCTIMIGFQAQRAVRWSPACIGGLVGLAYSPKVLPVLELATGLDKEVLVT